MELPALRSMPRSLEWLIMGLGIGLAVFLGLVTISPGPTALIYFVLPVVAVFVLAQPMIGVLLLAFIIPLQNMLASGSGLTAVKLLGMFVFGAWILKKLHTRSSWRHIFSTRLFIAAVGFLGYALASVLWAQFPDDAYVPLMQLFQMLLFTVLIIDLIDSWQNLDRLVKTVVLAAFIAAVLTIEQFFVGGVRRAGENVGGGVNTTATLLVVVIPFAFYLLRSKRNTVWRPVAIAYVVVAIIGVAVTFSRMNLLMLPVIIAAQYWGTLRSGKGRAWLLILTCVIVLALSFVPLELVQSRVETIGPYLEATFSDGQDYAAETTSGRGYHLKVGYNIFSDNPVLGVGYHNYGAHFLYNYQFLVSGGDRVWSSKRSPHSSHVGLLAELGFVGVLLWLALMGVALRNLIRAWWQTSRTKPSAPFFMIEAVTYAYLAQILAYGWYTNIHSEKFFWMLLGVSVVIRRLAGTSHIHEQLT